MRTQWKVTAAVLPVLILTLGCGNGAANKTSTMAGLAAEAAHSGVIQSTVMDAKAKTVYVRIVRNDRVKPNGHGAPNLAYHAKHITIPTGWTVRVYAHHNGDVMGVSIIPYPKGGQSTETPRNLGTVLKAAPTGQYAILPDSSGQHGSVLDFITVSDTATAPSVYTD